MYSRLFVISMLAFSLKAFAVDIDALMNKKIPPQKNHSVKIIGDESIANEAESRLSTFRAHDAEQRVMESQSQQQYTQTYPACLGDVSECWSFIENKGDGEVAIKCLNGRYSGEVKDVCQNDKGKWADGCGMTSSFAFHYNSLAEVAKRACDL